MSAPDNFHFAEIQPPSTPDERRIIELMRYVVREELRTVVRAELRRRDQDIMAIESEALEAFRIARCAP